MNVLKENNFIKDLESKYYNKIIRDKSTKMLSCKFYNKEEIEIFKKEQNIKFKRFNLDTLEGIEYENKRISSVLNLRERLIDTELSKEYCDKLGIKKGKIIIVNSGYNERGNYRDGTAVHISKSHSELGNSSIHIKKIMGSFENPKELRVALQTDIPNRYIFSLKCDKKKIYYILVDKKDDNIFEFFDVFIRPSTDFDKKIKKGKIVENELMFDLN